WPCGWVIEYCSPFGSVRCARNPIERNALPTTRPGPRSKAQSAQLLGVTLPLLGDLDPHIEIHSATQQRLDVRAGSCPDLLESLSLAAEDDGFLTVPLDVQHRVHVDEILPVLPGHHLLDRHREGMRQDRKSVV